MSGATRRTVLSAPLAWAVARSAGAVEAQDAAIDRAVRDAIGAGDVPGAIIGVRTGGRQSSLRAQGRAALNGPALEPDTVIWVASMTKSLATASVMMMADAGRLHLDDPIGRFIPEFAARPRLVRSPKPGFSWPTLGPGQPAPRVEYDLRPAKRDITLRDVLSMTSGLQTIGIPNPAIPEIGPDTTVAEWTPKLAEAPLDFEPGSRFGYSNATAFELAVRAVEVASGQDYAVFMRERIFGPLGMKDSSLGPRADIKDRTLAIPAINQITNGHFTSGSAGLFTTAADYGRFQQMLLDGGSVGTVRLLSGASAAAMARPGAVGHPGIGPEGYGGLTDRITPGLKMGLGTLVVTDGRAAGVPALPNGSFGWDGVGTRRYWVIPSRHTTITMLVPVQLKPGGAVRLHRAIETAVLT